MATPNVAQSASDPYRLNRDALATTRLNLQYYIWKESMKYILHPSIKLPESNVSIADVGTGTGIWLHDLSREYPQAKFDGFDISSEQYPAAGFLPPNVNLGYLNILKEIPSEYVEKYDVVHARLLVQVVNQSGGDPRPIIQNLMKLVKPGGYIQWEEPNDDAGNRKLLKSDPSVSSEFSEKLLAGLNARFQSKAGSWSAHLADAFESQGLVNVKKEEYDVDSYVLILDQMNNLNLYGELLSKVPTGEREKLQEYHGKAVTEARNGVAWKVRRYAFVGQKQ